MKFFLFVIFISELMLSCSVRNRIALRKESKSRMNSTLKYWNQIKDNEAIRYDSFVYIKVKYIEMRFNDTGKFAPIYKPLVVQLFPSKVFLIGYYEDNFSNIAVCDSGLNLMFQIASPSKVKLW
jgi:hypothetical protein